MSERRTQKRWHVFYHLRAFERDTDELLGIVIDVSETGIMLGSEKPLSMDHSYHMWMEIPFEEDDRARLQIDAEPRWSKIDAAQGLYEYGFLITGLMPRAQLVIQDLIEDLKLNAGHTDRPPEA